MKYVSILVIGFCVFGNIACSLNEDIPNKIERASKSITI